ncbi:MAG: hypothetical protein OXR66_06110 [Candidatus Woesearchaeota archaeon]|nr:hypothetical protein [Candidatus Woesearchaeota archaeon]
MDKVNDLCRRVLRGRHNLVVVNDGLQLAERVRVLGSSYKIVTGDGHHKYESWAESQERRDYGEWGDRIVAPATVEAVKNIVEADGTIDPTRKARVYRRHSSGYALRVVVAGGSWSANGFRPEDVCARVEEFRSKIRKAKERVENATPGQDHLDAVQACMGLAGYKGKDGRGGMGLKMMCDYTRDGFMGYGDRGRVTVLAMKIPEKGQDRAVIDRLIAGAL